MDRGFVFAIAHIRGGDDLGYSWYEAAKLKTKKVSFDDFIACSDFLISEKYTDKGNIVISGGSAGGTLVGAAMNMRPELFKAVVTKSPFVDVMNTLLDETLPLTKVSYTEFGNPKDKEFVDYIKSYSPYDNINKAEYPNVLAFAGISDPRVNYWEAAKWIAKLRDYHTNDSVMLLKMDMDSGHFGSADRFKYLEDYALQFAFIFKVFGISPFVEKK
ncbi:MAG UNVERIFIED_CONTAM: prolyl oligopeptidase family serine peptidase [Rickettsiaceae bacterium]